MQESKEISTFLIKENKLARFNQGLIASKYLDLHLYHTFFDSLYYTYSVLFCKLTNLMLWIHNFST